MLYQENWVETEKYCEANHADVIIEDFFNINLNLNVNMKYICIYYFHFPYMVGVKCLCMETCYLHISANG